MAVSRFYSNIAVPGTLGNTGGISNSATSMFLTATPVGYPTQYPFTLALEPGTANMELVSVTAGLGTAGTPWTITRGYDGTVAVAHAQTVAVQHNLSQSDVATSRTHENQGSGSGVHGLPSSAWSTAAFAVINETTLANSTTASQTWSSISGVYSHLMIVIMGRLTETTQQSDYLRLQFNGDAGSNYGYLQYFANNAGGSLTNPAAATAFGGTSIPFGILTAAQGGTAVNAGAVWAIIPWYTSTAFNKLVIAQSGGGNGTSAFVDGRMFWGMYNPASQVAVTSITVTAPAGSDFLTGTSFGLYGLS